MNYSYSLNGKEMTVYENDSVLATVSDVSKNGAEELFAEIVFELRGVTI